MGETRMELIMGYWRFMSKKCDICFALFLWFSGASMNADPRGDRLQIMLTSEEVRMIDDWRFSHRMPSRSSAVRELLKRGLLAEGFQLSEPNSRSKDYGLAATDPVKKRGKGLSNVVPDLNGNGRTSRER